jgi:hypothetical protein
MFVVFSVSLADDFEERTLAGKLKPLDVTRLVAPGKYPDGDGLYLVIAGPKSKNWSAVSLREARIKRDAARQQVRTPTSHAETLPPRSTSQSG